MNSKPLAVLFALLFSTFGRAPVGLAGEEPPRGPDDRAATRSSSPALDEAIRKLKMPGVSINLAERCVDVEGRICLDKGMLELVVCTEGTKEHESIVAIAARPMHIHTALLLLGAKAGNPATRRAPQGADGSWVDIPPSGSPVEVLLVLPDKTGKPVEHPVSEFITRGPPDSAAPEDGAAGRFPTHAFLFAGSHLVGEGPGPRNYECDESGNVISIATFGDELLCLSGIHSDERDALVWQVNAAGLPPVGSNVTLRLRPQQNRQPAPVAPLQNGRAPETGAIESVDQPGGRRVAQAHSLHEGHK